jgi:hypothetical protein
MSTEHFKKYFKLEEAVALLPSIREILKAAHTEISVLQDDVILYRRLLSAKKDSGRQLSNEEAVVLQEKFEAYEAAIKRWEECFQDQGIIARELSSGLFDFPYRSEKSQQDFLLCWRFPEEGIFYFHTLQEGYSGRHPIILLPD